MPSTRAGGPTSRRKGHVAHTPGRGGGALYLEVLACQDAPSARRDAGVRVERMALHPPIDAPAGSIAEALRALRNDFSVALWTPGNPFAVGAIIRVAHNFLAREIFLVGRAPYYAKASMGMHKYETIVEVDDAEGLLRQTGGRPLWAVERETARASIYGIERFPTGVVFVFGSERFGLPREVMDRADDVVGIPVYGVNQSLPLAVAAGIVMSEWARRHYIAGRVI
jgi:tRNA G18 (ribose-2'-O)-methylase SpoU